MTNVLNTEQGAAFFVDLEKLIEEEIKIENKRQLERKKHFSNTALYIPLYEKSSPALPNPSTKKHYDLSSTFTKEDFAIVQNGDTAGVCPIESIEIQPTVTKPFPINSQLTLKKYRPTRKSLESITHSPRDQFKRVNSSPNISKGTPPLQQIELSSKSYQEIKYIDQQEIYENLKSNNESIGSVWNKTFSRLPKLPNWVLQKHSSLDSTVMPFASPEPAHAKSQQDVKLVDQQSHNIKIEEMFSQCQQKQDYSAANILPPINSSPSRKSTTSPPLPKKKSITPTKRKPKQAPKLKEENTGKGKKTKTPSPKKAKKRVKPTNTQQKTQETGRGKKLNKTKKPKPLNTVESENMMESASNVFITNIEDSNAIQDEVNHEEQLLGEIKSKNISSFEMKDVKPDGGSVHKTVDSETYDNSETLDDFYDAVLAAKPIRKLQVNRTLFLPELDIDLLENSNLTKINIENSNALNIDKHVVNSTEAIDLDTCNLTESIEQSLSLDDNLNSQQITLGKQVTTKASHLKFLSRISEEKSHNNSTVRSVKAPTVKSSFISSDDNTFKEMSKLMFQPGLVPVISPYLKSMTLNRTFSSDSPSTLCSNDRPYLRSVLGMASPCSIYSSSSGASQNTDDVSVLEWQKGKMIDKGAFGVVYQGLTSNAQLIAVKEVNIGESKNTARNFRKLQDEISILKGLKHPNVIKFIGTSLQDGVVYIFMEYIAGGSLAGLIASFGPLNESIYQRYTKQIMSAVTYLHACGVIHRDIKGANILITVKGSIKLIDFGCAKELSLSLGSVMLLKSIKGTPYWMAPEVIKGTGCNHKSDIWSIGCTVMEMATGKPPWSEYAPYAAMYAVADENNIIQSLDDTQHSKEAVDFVNLCMQRDMNARPSAADLLTHPFVCGVT